MTVTAPEKIFSIGQDPDRIARDVREDLQHLLTDVTENGFDPATAEEKAIAAVNRLRQSVRAHARTYTRAHAHDKARVYRVHGYKAKWNIEQIAAGLALHAVSANGYPEIQVLKGAILEFRQAIDSQAQFIADAAIALRWWSEFDVEPVDSVRRHVVVEDPREVLKYYGLAYRHWRGENVEMWKDETAVDLGVEGALRRVGNYALNAVLNPPEGDSWNMIRQIRLDSLTSVFIGGMVSRIVVKMTHGRLDFKRPDKEIWIDAEHMSEFEPKTWRMSEDEQVRFKALVP